MPSTISAGTTAGTAIAISGDTTGNLAFQTNGTTTAMTIDTSQNATFVGNILGTASTFQVGVNTSGKDLRLGVLSGGNGRVEFYSAGSEGMRLDTSQNFLFNSGYGSVATAYGCRAWANWNGTSSGTITPRGSGNVSSVTKNGTGDYTVNFTNALVDANYSSVSTAGELVGDNNSTTRILAMSTSSVRIGVKNGSFAYTDYGVVSIAIFR